MTTIIINTTITVDGTQPWIIWNPTNSKLTIIATSNLYGGLHEIHCILTDGIPSSVQLTFFVEVQFNFPLVWNETTEVEHVKMIVFTTKNVTYNPKELFINPEPFPFSITYLLNGGQPLPYFMVDYLNGTLMIRSKSAADIGIYAIEINGLDDAGWVTTLTFNVLVNPCYYKCSYCWDAYYNTCNDCFD